MRTPRFPPLRLVAALAALTIAVGIAAPGVRAESADPGIAIEGWYARTKPPSPQIPTPQGPVSPGQVPAPQAPDTGAYVVSGGAALGAEDDDTGWAVFQWDLLSYIGATVDRFEVTFTQAPDNRGDFGTPVVQACDVVEPFGAAPGANPWEAKPAVSCASSVAPTTGTDDAGRDTYTFDVTDLAERWIEVESYGLAIVPGSAEQASGYPPFQLTLAGYNSTAADAEAVRPAVVFEFSAADDLGGGFGDGGGVAAPAPFEPTPDLDVLPDDVGSAPLPAVDVPAEDAAGGGETAAPPARDVPTSPVGSSTGFPWFALLLLPTGLLAYWALGTVLGPAGEPLPTREGGVRRLLAQRRAAAAGPASIEGGAR